jgi:hypothetical protein
VLRIHSFEPENHLSYFRTRIVLSFLDLALVPITEGLPDFRIRVVEVKVLKVYISLGYIIK